MYTPYHITQAHTQIHVHTHVPHLSQLVGAVQRLQEGVHIASGTLVLETNKASVLTRVPAAQKSR